MNYNYHTHTSRCGHASGTEEEYVLRAIECGVKHMGFSDHVPFRRPDGQESSWRMPLDRVADYKAEIERLKKEYADRIEISVGFEMECYPDAFPEMLKNARAYGAEYLICGQHFISPEQEAHLSDIQTDLFCYVEAVVAAIRTGVFTYIAHPDLFYDTSDLAAYRREMRKICVASREHNVPLEINFLGIRSHRGYPCHEFWKLAGEEGAPVTFGCDAHDADSAYDCGSLERAKEIVNKYKLNYIGKPTIRRL